MKAKVSVIWTVTNPKTGRKELWVDGKLVAAYYPPPQGGTW